MFLQARLRAAILASWQQSAHNTGVHAIAPRWSKNAAKASSTLSTTTFSPSRRRARPPPAGDQPNYNRTHNGSSLTPWLSVRRSPRSSQVRPTAVDAASDRRRLGPQEDALAPAELNYEPAQPERVHHHASVGSRSVLAFTSRNRRPAPKRLEPISTPRPPPMSCPSQAAAAGTSIARILKRN